MNENNKFFKNKYPHSNAILFNHILKNKYKFHLEYTKVLCYSNMGLWGVGKLPKRFLPELVLISVCFFWGVTFVLVQNAIEELPPYSFLAVRFFTAFVLIWLINKFFFKENIWNLAAIQSGLLVGFFLFLGYALQTFSLLYTTSGKSGFFTGMNVAFVPLIALLLFRHKIKAPILLGVICSIIGLYFLSGSIVGMNKGDILALGCAAAFAIQMILTGKYTNKIETYAFVFWQLVMVAFCSGILSLFFENVQPSVFLKPVVWTAILVTSAIATVFGYVAQTVVQRKVSPARVGVIFTLEPVFAAVSDYYVNGITLTNAELFGCCIIILGILLSEIPWNTKKAADISPEAVLSKHD
jgi:drug/metabolite transporter (DMT)-like permease